MDKRVSLLYFSATDCTAKVVKENAMFFRSCGLTERHTVLFSILIDSVPHWRFRHFLLLHSSLVGSSHSHRYWRSSQARALSPQLLGRFQEIVLFH